MKTKTKFPYLPRTHGIYGCQGSFPFVHNSTWVESEMMCSDRGKFERRGLVRHSKTNQLIRVRADVPDTYFSIPATSATEYGYLSVVDIGEDYGLAEIWFHPYKEQTQTPTQYRRETRKAYK